MKDSPLYAQLLRQMRVASNEEFVADLTRFVDSFADHDDDCPGYGARGREEELAACSCGFARRHDLLDEVQRRLASKPAD
ncbi:MAG: hypothetical protein ABI458_03495 [Chloroflexota bacterium]